MGNFKNFNYWARIVILENIVMLADHEVEFDKVLVDELERQKHEPIFFITKDFPFKVDYKIGAECLDSKEADILIMPYAAKH
jgi:hypothetical protein